MADGFLWRDAEVTYPDWVGTAQLDQRMTGKQFEEIIGFDGDAWMIIGLDIGGGESGHELRVIAVPSDALPPGGNVVARYAEANGGEVHATEFLVHDVDPYAVLRAITHMFELRMRIASCEGLPIRIVAQSDIPEQP